MKINNFHRVLYIFLRWIAMNYLLSQHSTELFKKRNAHGFEYLTSSVSSYSTAPSVFYFFANSSQIDSDSKNVGKQMRWIFYERRWISRWNFVRIAVKYGELFFSTHSLHKFATDVGASNYCKKCGEFRFSFLKEMQWNSVKYFTSPQSPQSPHFLQKCAQKYQPGIVCRLKYNCFNSYIGRPLRVYVTRLCSVTGRDFSAVSAHYSAKSAQNLLKLCKKWVECAEMSWYALTY